ncbi:MAG: LLM class F420-dependent oxidoreductase [Gammaproteobacteria bacterium]
MPRFSVCLFATDRTIAPVELAAAVEARELDGLYLPEHTHLPLSSRSPFFADGELPEPYRRTVDPFVALAMAAAVTTRIRLGTGITLLTQHDPIVLAKTVATLDRLSGGRVTLGIGAGWNAEELENHGTPYAQRWPILRERVLALREMWAREVVEYHGQFVDFGPMYSYPKPLQPGGPPFWIGSNSRYALDRIAEYADGWMPIRGRAGGATIAGLREACARCARRFEDLTLALYYAPVDEAACRQHLAEVWHELIFSLPSAAADAVLPKLDEIAALARRLRAG